MKKLLIIAALINPAFACQDGLHLGLWMGDNSPFAGNISASERWNDGGQWGHGFDLNYKWHNISLLDFEIDSIKIGWEHKSHLFRGEPFDENSEDSYNGIGVTAAWNLTD
jgi:hypothetical protein